MWVLSHYYYYFSPPQKEEERLLFLAILGRGNLCCSIFGKEGMGDGLGCEWKIFQGLRRGAVLGSPEQIQPGTSSFFSGNFLWTEPLSQVCAEGGPGGMMEMFPNPGGSSGPCRAEQHHPPSQAILPSREIFWEVFLVFPVPPQGFVPSQSSPCSLRHRCSLPAQLLVYLCSVNLPFADNQSCLAGSIKMNWGCSTYLGLEISLQLYSHLEIHISRAAGQGDPFNQRDMSGLTPH